MKRDELLALWPLKYEERQWTLVRLRLEPGRLADPAFGERKYGLGFGLALAPNPNGGAPVLERYYGGGVFSANLDIVPRRDLVLLLMMQVYPTNHGGSDRVSHRIVNAAVEN